MSEEQRLESEKKRSFLLGAATGIAVMVILGGVFVLGRQYGNTGKLAEKDSANVAAQPTANQPQEPTVDGSKIAPVSKDDHIRGDNNAPITMIEYSDYQCPFCGRFHTTMQKIMEDYKGKVRMVFRHFPLRSIHPYAQKGAEAAECANDQGKFWEMHDKMFDLNNSQNFSLDTVKKAAQEIGLDVDKFNSCLDAGKYAPAVEEDYQDGLAGGVNGTPGTFINGQYVAGALPYEDIKSIIDSLL